MNNEPDISEFLLESTDILDALVELVKKLKEPEDTGILNTMKKSDRDLILDRVLVDTFNQAIEELDNETDNK